MEQQGQAGRLVWGSAGDRTTLDVPTQGSSPAGQHPSNDSHTPQPHTDPQTSKEGRKSLLYTQPFGSGGAGWGSGGLSLGNDSARTPQGLGNKG